MSLSRVNVQANCQDRAQSDSWEVFEKSMFRDERYTLCLRRGGQEASRFLANCQCMDRALGHACAFRVPQR
jgi:hypothetical protein